MSQKSRVIRRFLANNNTLSQCSHSLQQAKTTFLVAFQTSGPFLLINFKKIPSSLQKTHQHHHYHTQKCSSSYATSVSATTRKKRITDDWSIFCYFFAKQELLDILNGNGRSTKQECRLRWGSKWSGLLTTTEALSSVRYLIIQSLNSNWALQINQLDNPPMTRACVPFETYGDSPQSP